MKKGFTLVELVIVIVIVGILSIVAVPIYKGYVEKARATEGQALVGAIWNAQKIYYALYGEYHTTTPGGAPGTDYDETLGIDARGNKYFKTFYSREGAVDPTLPIAWAIGPDFYIGRDDVFDSGNAWIKYDTKTGIEERY